ncbi:MAG: UvrB domain 3-containing protein, partial [Dolichospermum sp.]
MIVDAIKDENVLRFAVEYVGKYQQKAGANNLDIAVEYIDTKELLESPARLKKITEYILTYHDQKTKNREFTAMFCVSNIETLIKYYELFKQQEIQTDKPLKIATIFSYAVNEENPEANGIITEESFDIPSNANINVSNRDKLE